MNAHLAGPHYHTFFRAADETVPTGNKCPTCGGMANFFDQSELDKFEEQDRQYYQGNGAPALSTTIQWFKAFSDGSAQQFMNSFFLFFLSMFSTLFGICVVWNWFCSCHKLILECKKGCYCGCHMKCANDEI